jgi:hypothetical protein
MPLGTEGWRETWLLKVTGSSNTRTTSACLNSDQCSVSLCAIGQRARGSS